MLDRGVYVDNNSRQLWTPPSLRTRREIYLQKGGPEKGLLSVSVLGPFRLAAQFGCGTRSSLGVISDGLGG